MDQLTSDQIYRVRYYWTDKGTLQRSYLEDWDDICKRCPLLAKVYTDYQHAKQLVDLMVKNLKPFDEEDDDD